MDADGYTEATVVTPPAGPDGTLEYAGPAIICC